MRVEVYKGGALAAVVAYGAAPVYSGVWGDQARRLVERPHDVRNRWTGEGRRGPLTGSPDWWLATIYSVGWAGKGFTVFGPRIPHAGALVGRRHGPPLAHHRGETPLTVRSSAPPRSVPRLPDCGGENRSRRPGGMSPGAPRRSRLAYRPAVVSGDGGP